MRWLTIHRKGQNILLSRQKINFPSPNFPRALLSCSSSRWVNYDLKFTNLNNVTRKNYKFTTFKGPLEKMKEILIYTCSCSSQCPKIFMTFKIHQCFSLKTVAEKRKAQFSLKLWVSTTWFHNFLPNQVRMKRQVITKLTACRMSGRSIRFIKECQS